METTNTGIISADKLMRANLIASPYLGDTVQVRFPKSKKRRIRKKWAKRSQNWRVKPSDRGYVMDGGATVIGDPGVIAAMRKIAGEILATRYDYDGASAPYGGGLNPYDRI